MLFKANAQNSEIQGVVSGELSTIPYANVYLEGTSLGTSSEENGKYLLKNIPPGKYKLKATVLGYREVAGQCEMHAVSTSQAPKLR